MSTKEKKSPWSKQRRRPSEGVGRKETTDSPTPLLPTGVDARNSEKPGCQVPGAMERPRTPVPWSKRRASRMERSPSGDRKESSLSTSKNVCEDKETSAVATVVVGGCGDHQAWQTESITQVKMKAKPLNQQPRRLDAADVLENFLGHFLTYLHECPDRPYFRNMGELVPGSSYEYEKFLHPGEFEVMLSISVPDCIQYTEVEGYSSLFYTLTLLKKSRSFPAALLLEDGKTISPRNLMEEFWKHVDQFVKTFYSVPFPGWLVRLEKKKPHCPAVTLVMLDGQGARFMSVSLIPALEMGSQWPFMKKAKDLLEVKELPPLMQVFYFVAEQSPGRHNKETWRISFSHVEKEILIHHRSPQACRKYHKKECCRKDCLKMLEDLLTSLKMEYPQMLAHLSSYHAWTSFLHTLWEWKADADWNPCEATPCFERVLANFLREVTTAQLYHFFLPKCNLFGAKFFPPTKLKFLGSHLKEKDGTTMKTFSVSRKRSCSSPFLPLDMT